MPELSQQIETLYRVIGQIRPEPDQAGPCVAQPQRPIRRQTSKLGAFRLHESAARPTGRAASIRWTFKLYCLWFSLPLSVWFTSGWIGLFFYWRALSGTARFVEILSRRAPLPPKERAPARHRGFTSSPFRLSSFEAGPLKPVPVCSVSSSAYGGARCSAIEWEAE